MMGGPQPLVSVVVAVYNGGRYLKATLDSVLAQGKGPLQVIAVDDGSTDDSAEIIGSFGGRVEYVAQENSGPNVARNNGIRRARGRFLAFVDQDDLWLPDKLDRQLALLDRDSDAEVVFGHVRQFVSPELDHESPAKTPEDLGQAVPGYLPSTMLARRDSFLRVGLFDATLRMGELIDWISRARESGVTIHMLPDVVVNRRLHTTNIGLLEPQSRVDYLRAVKANLDRRRGKRQER